MPEHLDDKPHVVVPLLAFALIVNMFLFGVAYSNASFSGTEKSLPDIFAAQNISPQLDNTFAVIADNLQWSVASAAEVVKPQVVAFLGLSDYQYGQPRYTALNPNQSVAEYAIPSQDGAVLGATTQNPEYVVIQIK
ncbi:MAG: hypothetical protein JWO40_69 [Candidatus Doudnabacteria bacterium]|nr:hypothetical protein [Candidatus Doudnabacteria bacterium]